MLSCFRGFTFFWKRQDAQMKISRKLSSSKVKAQQPLGNNKKKNLDFQAARRQKPSYSYSLYLNYRQFVYCIYLKEKKHTHNSS